MSGRLTVTPGRIAFEPDRLSGVVVGRSTRVQTSPEVVMYKTRFMFPWMNTALLLRCDDDEHITVSPGGWARPSLRRALKAAGFVVVERRTWFSLGRKWAGA